jgi:hypothetical protein
MTDIDPDPESDVDVPPSRPVYACDRCGQPFAAESRLALHRGLAHPDDLTAAEREAFRAARDEEVADLRRFRLLALAALVALYFGFLFAYAVFA